jgi:hypothetical protein
MEVRRVLLLWNHIGAFQDSYENIPGGTLFLDKDWHNLRIYVSSMKTLSDASDLLEGETYPTASSVIPFLDQVRQFCILNACISGKTCIM